MLRNHHQHRCSYKALTQDILCLLPILRQLKHPLVSHPGLLPLLSPFIIYTCMDELGIYGARKAFCRLYGKGYDECLSSSNPGLQRCPMIRFCRISCCLLRSSPLDMPLHLRDIRSKIHPNQKFNLAVLGVCRHLYEQAHHVLWTTNTLSFDDPVSFGKFFSSFNLGQLHKLTLLLAGQIESLIIGLGLSHANPRA